MSEVPLRAYGNTLQCLNCDRWAPQQHDGWEPSKYADDRRYKITDLRYHLHYEKGKYEPNKEHGWPGNCLFSPTPIETRSVHVCGQWQANPVMVENWGQWVSVHEAVVEAKKLRQQLADLKAVHKRLVDRVKVRKPARAEPEPETTEA